MALLFSDLQTTDPSLSDHGCPIIERFRSRPGASDGIPLPSRRLPGPRIWPVAHRVRAVQRRRQPAPARGWQR